MLHYAEDDYCVYSGENFRLVAPFSNFCILWYTIV